MGLRSTIKKLKNKLLSFTGKFRVSELEYGKDDSHACTVYIQDVQKVSWFNGYNRENLYIIKGNWEKIFGSGALSGKMLLVRIIVNSKIDVCFRAG